MKIATGFRLALLAYAKSVPLLVLGLSAAFGQGLDTPPAGISDLPRIRDFTAQRVSSNSRYVGSNDDSKRIMPGETLVMADLQGPGIVDHIWVTVADNEYAWPRLVRLRIYYDGKKTPSVDVPLGDFFGVGHGYERNLDSQLIRDSSFGRARNSYWPIPFLRSCKITVTDEGNRPVGMFYYQVDWQKHASLPANIGYFHGYYRQERPARTGKNYEFLNVKGKGHYVGTVLSILQAGVGWFGEGDDLFFVDGAEHPQLHGTGSEDYFNDAWGLRASYGAWYGTPVAEGERVGSRLTGYRWHVPDPVPFTNSLWAGIEHAGWTYNENGTLRSGFEERPDFFSSAAFWYQIGVNEGLPEPPYGAARLPLGNAQQIAVEDSVKEVTTQNGKATVQREVDWGRDLLLFESQGPHSQINIPIDVPETGRYELVARLAQGPTYGDYYALLDGKPTNIDNREAATSEMPSNGPEVFRNYLPEIYIAVEHPLGWLQLGKGRHTLSFVYSGRDTRASGYDLGINDVILEKVPDSKSEPQTAEEQVSPTATGGGEIVYRGIPLGVYRERLQGATPAARAALLRSIGSFGKDASSASGDIASALRDRDLEVRCAAAWAASQLETSGGDTVLALGQALKDSSPRVRSMAAIALRSMKDKAAPAAPALLAALGDSEPYVRALAADAIGNMGAAAAPSVPALSQHLLRKDEQVFVLRSIATALGNIGPAASGALPALQQSLSMVRVSYVAETAISKIKQEPIAVWY